MKNFKKLKRDQMSKVFGKESLHCTRGGCTRNYFSDLQGNCFIPCDDGQRWGNEVNDPISGFSCCF